MVDVKYIKKLELSVDDVDSILSYKTKVVDFIKTIKSNQIKDLGNIILWLLPFKKDLNNSDRYYTEKVYQFIDEFRKEYDLGEYDIYTKPRAIRLSKMLEKNPHLTADEFFNTKIKKE